MTEKAKIQNGSLVSYMNSWGMKAVKISEDKWGNPLYRFVPDEEAEPVFG